MDSSNETALTDSSRFQIAENIHACEIDSEMVLLNPDNGLYYGLDAVGVRVWTLIKEQNTLGIVRDTILQEFDVTAEVLWQDLTRLVTEMRTHGLVLSNNPT